MDLSDTRVLLTGGAGLVGSTLADSLLDTASFVRIADDLSKGNRERLPADVEFVHADMRDPTDVASAITPDIDLVFHLAAYTDTNYEDDRTLFEENTEMTYNILERMDAVDVSALVFTSSSAVYGEAPRPTPEHFGPLEPISAYGAAKLADEALISTYAHTHDIQSWVFRFANIVGPYQRGNVIPDFIQKLVADPDTLEILGDGRQEKSYMYVEDCVDAIEHVIASTDEQYNLFNLGTHTTTSVTSIADIVADVLDVDPTYAYTGGDRGWAGDVPRMRLGIEKLSGLGWEPTYESDAAVRQAAIDLAAELTA